MSACKSELDRRLHREHFDLSLQHEFDLSLKLKYKADCQTKRDVAELDRDAAKVDLDTAKDDLENAISECDVNNCTERVNTARSKFCKLGAEFTECERRLHVAKNIVSGYAS